MQVHGKLRKQVTKKSVGVACCRINAQGMIEILMVCKRYTYAFSDFIHGKYHSVDNTTILNMLNKMTVDEKIDIWSMNFSQIYYRIFLDSPKPTSYAKTELKFANNFSADSGTRLRHLITKSTNGERLWELPKGRKLKNECDINCAVREFQEETGIKKTKYKIYPDATRTYSYIDNGVNYENKFYIAIMIDAQHERRKNRPDKFRNPVVSFKNQDQIGEINDIKWMSIENIRFVDTDNRLEKFVKPIFNFVKNRMRFTK